MKITGEGLAQTMSTERSRPSLIWSTTSWRTSGMSAAAKMVRSIPIQ
jgi:hypothetical protein